jgi:glycosyltransferase involved in cell wall biosynthesis
MDLTREEQLVADDESRQQNPLVSVCMVTYNHENWIAAAIDGVLAQQTSFDFELLVGDDCSTDHTTKIVQEYARKYPTIIRPVFNKKNVGLSANFSTLLNHCRGKFIAICEGDDFWTNPAKLERQVTFLEANPNYIICSHNSSRYYEADQRLEANMKYNVDFSYDQKRFLSEWLTQPLTCVFRNFFKDYTLLNRENIFCDPLFFYELLKHGDGYFMSENMSTFRVHMGALSSGLSRRQWIMNHIIMYDYLFKYNRRDKQLQKISARYCIILYLHNLKNKNEEPGSFKPLQEYLKREPGKLNKLITLLLRVPYYNVKRVFGYRNENKSSS